MDALKKKFREGRHAEAIAECEALCRREPANREARRLCATMHAMVGNYPRSLELLHELRNTDRKEDADVLFNIGMCERELKNFTAAAQYFGAFTLAFPNSADGWASLADCKLALGEFEEALKLAGHAIKLAPKMVPALVVRGDALQALGRVPDAIASYKSALALHPADDETLKKATSCMLESGQGAQAIELCKEILKVHPKSLTAKLGAEWVLSRLVPIWHVPMMNEGERNQAFSDGLAAVVTPDKVVFEIGAGSGLLAMMAAKAGAKKVVTCEAVDLVAETAQKIVKRNNLQDRVTVLAKTSQQVELGKDLPEKADILLHEIFSSELLGEHVLPAIEDAKARLLKPGGLVLPASASIMIALVGGEALGRNLHVSESFGFDLRDFNAIHPKRRPLYREDLAPVLLSTDVEAFRFDFLNGSSFPPASKQLVINATQAGLCYGVIQWIRVEMAPGIQFENHPSKPRTVSNWQHTIYGFGDPVQLQAGSLVKVDAMHDRTRPWFELATTGKGNT